MGLSLLYMLHKGFIPEKTVTHMAEQLFLAVKDKILYMKGAYAVAVICKSPVNNLFLCLRLRLFGVDQIHGVQYHLHIGGNKPKPVLVQLSKDYKKFVQYLF